MTDDNKAEYYLQNCELITEKDSENPEEVELAGYQVTRAELFAHSREPAVTMWPDKIKFNMACLRRFPGITHIQLLIHPEQKRLIIRPCNQELPDALRWATGGGEKEIKNRDMKCKIFAARVYELMDWNTNFKYKMLGKMAVCDDEVLFLFKLTDFELFINEGKYRGSYLPEDWRNYFGLPFDEHEEAFKVDPADGYI